MARFSVQVPDSVADWVKRSAKQEGVSQSAFISNMLSYALGSISKDMRIMDLEDEIKAKYSTISGTAKNLEAGNVISYCGATYEVTNVHPVEDGLILFDTIKKVKGQIVADKYHIVRHEEDPVNLVL